MREARAAARLKSERVVLILDVGSLPTQQPYIAMEFLDGVDLDQMLRDRGKVSLTEAVDLVLQICEPLAEAHAAGIVHRDIKPANVVVVQRRGASLVKVLDFGIAKIMLGDEGPKLTGTKATMGTPAFMSPEQIRGAKDVDHRADIWSLGITLFQLITGNLPFGGNTYAKLVMSVSREPTPQIPTNPALDAVLQRSLAKDRNERYSTIGELAKALEPFAGDRPQAAAIVQRCLALGAELQKRLGISPAAAPSGPGMQRTSTLPMGQAPTLPTAMTSTPAHGAPPLTTPSHGMVPMTTPSHGMVPMTSTPGHGSLPMTSTPGHGSLPMTSTPPHGAPPMATATQPATGSRVVVIALIALALIAVGAVVFALTR
jgi:serine/threonine-protein kinase